MTKLQTDYTISISIFKVKEETEEQYLAEDEEVAAWTPPEKNEDNNNISEIIDTI